MTCTLTQQIAAVKQVFEEKQQAGEVDLATVLQAALRTLLAKAASGGHVMPAAELANVSEASLTLYKQFEAEYHLFCQKETGAKGRMDGGQGQALHKIIAYLTEQSKTKDGAGALACWKYLLANWAKVPPFIQRQKALTSINKYLVECMDAIRKTNQPAVRVWPDQYNAALYAKLAPSDLMDYQAHLRKLGWRYNSQRQTWVAPN